MLNSFVIGIIRSEQLLFYNKKKLKKTRHLSVIVNKTKTTTTTKACHHSETDILESLPIIVTGFIVPPISTMS